MVRSLFAKTLGVLTVLAAVAIAVAHETEFLSIPQVLIALVGFVVLGLVTVLMSAKPGAAAAKAKLKTQARRDAIGSAKSGEARPPLGFNPHDGDAVVLVRHRRDHGFDVTRDGSSWFGGSSTIAAADWPHASTGMPMTPLAQIDLADAAAVISLPGLPASGALAFFVNVFDGPLQGAVRYIAGQTGQPTPPPAGLPPVENGFIGGPRLLGEAAEGQLLYPRMAIEMVGLTGEIMADHDARQAHLATLLGPTRQYHLGVSSFPDQFPAKDKPINRDCVTRFMRGTGLSLANGEKARSKLQSQSAEYRKRLAGLAPRLPVLEAAAQTPGADDAAIGAFRIAQSHVLQMNERAIRMEHEHAHFDAECASLLASVTALQDWASRGNRWAMLTEVEQAEIAPLLARWTDYGALGQLHLDATRQVHRSMGDAANETLGIMAVAPDAVFADLPEAVRVAVDGPYRQPTHGLRHQMFGPPTSIQTAAEDFSDHYLLLQINTDDLQGFSWGDMGILQFWIRPADLVAGNWSAANFSRECH